MSYSSTPYEEDDMFERDSKFVVVDDDSTMFANEDESPKMLIRDTLPMSRPSSLNPASSSANGHQVLKPVLTKGEADVKPLSFASPSSPLDSLRSWSSGAFLYARRYVTEHLGRRGNGSAGGDPDTAARIVALREQQRHYARLLQAATMLVGQLDQIIKTQRALGGAFGELSQCGGDVALGEQFACSTDVMRLMAKHGDSLLASLGVFRQSMSTLCNTTIEDTLATVKNCENARIKYDLYKARADKLRISHSSSHDSSLAQRLRDTEAAYQIHKQKYDRSHGDLVIKLKFLEENKNTVCQKHLYLLHKAFMAYVSGNHQGVEEILKQCRSLEPSISSSNLERFISKPAMTTG